MKYPSLVSSFPLGRGGGEKFGWSGRRVPSLPPLLSVGARLHCFLVRLLDLGDEGQVVDLEVVEDPLLLFVALQVPALRTA